MAGQNDAQDSGKRDERSGTYEKIGDSLLSFIDFLYAIVFGLVLDKAYSGIIMDHSKSYTDRGISLLLISGIFYFLCWDWLQGRLLMLRNPLKRYRRFFMEILIAFGGYGAALMAGESNSKFLLFIAAIYIVGVMWARSTIFEHPETGDMSELLTIKNIQPVLAVCTLLVYIFMWYHKYTLESRVARVGMVVFVWCSIFVYEISTDRTLVGIDAGPGVPFVTWEQVIKTRNFFGRRIEQCRKIFKRMRGR